MATHAKPGRSPQEIAQEILNSTFGQGDVFPFGDILQDVTESGNNITHACERLIEECAAQKSALETLAENRPLSSAQKLVLERLLICADDTRRYCQTQADDFSRYLKTDGDMKAAAIIVGLREIETGKPATAAAMDAEMAQQEKGNICLAKTYSETATNIRDHIAPLINELSDALFIVPARPNTGKRT